MRFKRFISFFFSSASRAVFRWQQHGISLHSDSFLVSFICLFYFLSSLYVRVKPSITCYAGYFAVHLLRKYTTMLGFLPYILRNHAAIAASASLSRRFRFLRYTFGWNQMPASLSLGFLPHFIYPHGVFVKKNFYQKIIMMSGMFVIGVCWILISADICYFPYVQRHIGPDIWNFFISWKLVIDLIWKQYKILFLIVIVH